MVSRRTLLRATTVSIVASLLTTGLLLDLPRTPTPQPAVARDNERVGDLPLPPPRLEGRVSVERSLVERRSIREYSSEPLDLDELSQVLWSAQGVSNVRHGFRTSPSAGATFPLEVYALVRQGGVRLPTGGFLEPGSYKYIVDRHTLRLVRRGDYSLELYRACVEQEWVLKAPVNLVFTAVFERTTRRYGERGVRYVWIEVGHAGQNVYLQATALGLATVAIGAFYDDWVRRIIGAPSWEAPTYVMTLAVPLRRPQAPGVVDLISYWGRGQGEEKSS